MGGLGGLSWGNGRHMTPLVWAVLVIAAWMALVLPLAVACGRAFAAGESPRQLDGPAV